MTAVNMYHFVSEKTMPACPHCHSAEFTDVPAAASGVAGSLLRKLWDSRHAPAPALQRRCSLCQTVYSSDEAIDQDEKPIQAPDARMEERISGFRDVAPNARQLPLAPTDSLPQDAAPSPGREPPRPYLAPSLQALSKAAAGIGFQEPEAVKCRRCGHFAFLVRTPESRCTGCGRLYAKMDEEAQAERREALRKA
jgi:ribosomal protein L37E